MLNNVKTIISEKEIEHKIGELAGAIDQEYGPPDSNNELIIIGIMTGVFMFLGDLVRHLQTPCRIDFIGLHRYRAGETPGKIDLLFEPRLNLSNRRVLMVDCILDKGVTLDFALSTVKKRSPKDVKSCVLLKKETHRERDVHPDFSAFSIPDIFVFGYGIDLDGKYRNLPYIGVRDEPGGNAIDT